jgi:hypothetical protein
VKFAHVTFVSLKLSEYGVDAIPAKGAQEVESVALIADDEGRTLPSQAKGRSIVDRYV